MSDAPKPELSSRHVYRDWEGQFKYDTGCRWFIENPPPGFDGTANGHGFRSPQAAYRAYFWAWRQQTARTATLGDSG